MMRLRLPNGNRVGRDILQLNARGKYQLDEFVATLRCGVLVGSIFRVGYGVSQLAALHFVPMTLKMLSLPHSTRSKTRS